MDSENFTIEFPPHQEADVLLLKEPDYEFIEKWVLDWANGIHWTKKEFKALMETQIEDEQRYQRELNQRIIDAQKTYPYHLSEIELGFIDACTESSKERIKKCKRLKDRCYAPKHDNTKMDIERAKEIPIDEFVDFRGGVARCVWHNDKNPSMHYYKKNNRVWCFACNKGGDVIDVVRAINNFSFLDAVNFILRK